MSESKVIAESLGMTTSMMLPEKRQKGTKRFADETVSEQVVDSNPEDCFKCQVFYALQE